ncbi:MAG: hypothetical protein KDE45_13600 [Caldilineaceae bacterium]|nr:hypothetical protein [Caldilineaceae bacterium]
MSIACKLSNSKSQGERRSAATMLYSSKADADLLRKMVMTLEPMERSPPEPIILDLAAFAGIVGCSAGDASEALDRLADLLLIEGPGPLNDAWLFRRVTARGRFFLDQVRSERRWSEIKSAYLQRIE